MLAAKGLGVSYVEAVKLIDDEDVTASEVRHAIMLAILGPGNFYKWAFDVKSEHGIDEKSIESLSGLDSSKINMLIENAP